MPEKKPFDYKELNERERTRPELYHTTAWRKLRMKHLTANPLCKQCELEGRITEAKICDHITSIRDAVDQDAAFYDESNLQSLCRNCHNKKTWRDSNKRKELNG